MSTQHAISKIEQLLQDLTDITSSSPGSLLKQVDHNLRIWASRTYEEIRNCGLADSADSFAKTSHVTRRNDYRGNLSRLAEAKKANLTALLQDMRNNPEFYEAKLKNQAAVSVAEPNAKASSVFLGHGRNALWAKVQMFLEKELGLPVEVWEAESREGKHTIEVLRQLMQRSGFAVLILTGEDITAEGDHRARQNVIHEIGLFQGRLGFEKVALLEQEGIEGWTNLLGLQTIRFRGEDVESTFYRLQKMLEREGTLARRE